MRRRLGSFDCLLLILFQLYIVEIGWYLTIPNHPIHGITNHCIGRGRPIPGPIHGERIKWERNRRNRQIWFFVFSSE